jgi:hypothetical protein
MFAKDEVDIAKKKSEGQTFEMLKNDHQEHAAP